MNWGVGRYESTAVQLFGAAETVVRVAAPGAGEHVLDLGCGTGNAALLAARDGARVTGVDPAERLLEVARARLAAEGVDARLLSGEAAALPLDDGEADAVVSVFGVIFAPDSPVAVAEMARVTAPGGRIVLSAWIPEGPLMAAARLRRELLAPDGRAPAAAAFDFAWHDRDALAQAFGAQGFGVTVSEHALTFAAPSAADFVEGEFRDHPMWVAGRETLEARGLAQSARERALAIFAAANEDPEAFAVTSRYVVAVARRG